MTSSYRVTAREEASISISTLSASGISSGRRRRRSAELNETPAVQVSLMARRRHSETSKNINFKKPSQSGAATSILTPDGYDLTGRSQQFQRVYPGLRGQYSLDLVQCTPYLQADEKVAVEADHEAVFQALGWPRFAYTSRLDSLVPDSRTPFRHCVTFCWYAYAPYSSPGSRMRTLYQNVLFKDSATWRVSNKQAMLRRLLLAEAASKAAVAAGLVAAASTSSYGNSAASVSCWSFIPASQVYSLGREAAVVADPGLGLLPNDRRPPVASRRQQDAVCLPGSGGAAGGASDVTDAAAEAHPISGAACCIVKPAAGLRGRGIRLYRPPAAPSTKNRRQAARNFARFMLAEYGEPAVRSNFYIVQRYVDRPLLIRGRKFDLRVYLLVVPNMACGLACDSNPGRRGFYAFYHPGFARLSRLAYAGGISSDMRVHLTNSCLQEAVRGGGGTCRDPAPAAEQYAAAASASAAEEDAEGEDDEEATNWPPDRVNDYFNQRFNQSCADAPCRDWFRVTAQSDMQAILAYLASRFSRILCGSRAHNGYRLLGCDFLIDADLRVWLLELNSLPSLRLRNTCHRLVKSAMQREALALAIEVAHRSANGLPVTSRSLVMRENFRLVYSATNPRVQGRLVSAYSRRLEESGRLD